MKQYDIPYLPLLYDLESTYYYMNIPLMNLFMNVSDKVI